jgi:hypothetical protein
MVCRLVLVLLLVGAADATAQPVKYVRYSAGGTTSYGILDGDVIFDVPVIVGYISKYVTLEPGAVIYTGTPGTTKAMKPGDVVEIEIEGVGVLRNRVKKGETD